MPYVETLWNQQTPIERVHPYLARHAQCEVAVIGGGIAGALCAWHLRQAGHEVALVTRSAVGMGATAASGGILRFDHEDGMQFLIKKLGSNDALEAYRTQQAAVAGLERMIDGREDACGFARRIAISYVTGRAEAEQLKGDFELLARSGFNVAWLDRAAAGTMFSFPVQGAILYHAGAAEVDPYRLTNLLIADSLSDGMRVYEYTEVKTIQPLPSGVLLTTGLGQSLRVKAAVVATGEPPLALRPYLSTWRTYSLSTLSMGSPQGWGSRALLRHDREGLNLRTVGDSMLISGQNAPALSRASALAPARKRDILRYAWLENALKTMFPAMAGGVRAGYRFSARFSRAADGLPVIGPVPDRPGVYTVSGYGLDGATAGLIAGRLLVSWLKGDQPALGRLYAETRL